MHAAGQEVAISILAARYMRVMIPGLAFGAVNESLKRYLMAQNVVIPETIAMLVSTALSPLYNQILVVWAGESVQSRKLMQPVQAQAWSLLGLPCCRMPITRAHLQALLQRHSIGPGIQHWHTFKVSKLECCVCRVWTGRRSLGSESGAGH